MEKSSKFIAVNYHFTRKCNYHCGFCFHTAKTSHVENLDAAKEIIRQLSTYGFQKINFAGGEPFLPEYKTQLGEMMKYAKLEGNFESVSVISNGHYITEDWFELYATYLDIIGLSCDSDDDAIYAQIGRGFGEHTSKIKHASKLAKNHDVMLKLNTVVNSFNWDLDMSELINELEPMRWKIFQVLSIDGENVGELAKRNVDKFLISNAQFEQFIKNHKTRLLDPTIIKSESNEVMRDSYILIDEYGRFLDTSLGAKNPTRSILEVGIVKALEELQASAGGGFDEDAFQSRGGDYSDQWGRRFSGLNSAEVSLPKYPTDETD